MGITLEPTNVSIVQQSWVLVNQDLDSLGREFFTRIFARMPVARKLFGFHSDPNFLTSRSLRVHAIAVLRTIGKLVAGLTNLEAFTPVLLRLGRTHAAAGVPVESFGVMRGIMLELLAERLGDAWTPAVSRAWESAFDAIASSIMGYYPKEDAPHGP